MGRPTLPLGAHGSITVTEMGPRRFRARARVRDLDGRTRPVERWGASRAAAKRALQLAIVERVTPTGGGVTRESRVSDVAAAWLAELDRAVTAGDRSPNTARLYRGALHLHVLPVLGGLQLLEVSVPRCDACLSGIESANTARTARAALSGVLGYAVRAGALPANPVREASRRGVAPVREPRAMTAEERADWLDALVADPAASRHDLPDLTRFMLATGVRLAEALAVTLDDIDLRAGTVVVDWQITRVKGQGLVRRRRKGERGEQRSAVLGLPSWAVVMLRRRRLARGWGPLFPDSLGGWRDPSNTSRQIREARRRISARRAAAGGPGFDWLTSHVWRKTVATVLDDAGVPTRVISDQLNHAQVSMTQNRYLGRRSVSSEAAAALEAANPDAVSGG